MTEAAWAALTLSLTLVGALYTFWAWRARGAAAGTRGAALTLLPLSAYLTGTLEMFTEITGSVVDWATHLVLSPVVWAGIGTFGLSLLLFLVSARLRERSRGRADRPGPTTPGVTRSDATNAGPAATRAAPRRGALPEASRPTAPALDDDLADIEEILRRRGIT